MKKTQDPIGKLLGLRYKSHPWHGVEIGKNAPEVITVFIEMVPTDTVKYEVDKETGYLTIDRPQKFSSILPALYGFIPKTYCGESLAKISNEALNRDEIIGDKDPLDICILTEKEITHGDILLQARPIGGFRMIDGKEADDKIIAVLKGDAVYGEYEDIDDVPHAVLERLRHYFLTYKDMPGQIEDNCEITDVYDKKTAFKVIESAAHDYETHINELIFR